MGAALYAYHVLLNKPREFVMEHAYWGESFSHEQIEAFLKREGIPYEYVEDEDRLAEQVVDRLRQVQTTTM